MKIKQLLTKTLLVAVGLLAGQSAWGTDVPYTVGTPGTGDAWNERKYSDAYEIAPGEIYHFTFTNTSYGSNNWNNWLLDCKASADTSVDDWYFTMRSDNYGWGTSYNSAMRNVDFIWGDFQTVMNGATVDMYIDYNSTDKIIRTYVTITKSETTWHYNFASKAIDQSSVFLLLSEELANLNITTAEKVASLPNGIYTLYKRTTTNTDCGEKWKDDDKDNIWVPNTTNANFTYSIDGGLSLANTSPNANFKSSYSASRVLTPNAGSTVSMTAVATMGVAPGRDTSYDYITVGGVSLRVNGQNKKAQVYVHGVAQGEEVSATRGASYTFNVEINQATGDVTYSVSGGATIAEATASTSTIISNVVIGHSRGGGENYETNIKLTNIDITEQISAVSYANYTVHFKDNNGATVKDDEVRNGEVGSTVNANSADMATFYDGSYKYVYDNDGEGVEVTSDGTAELTVTYTKKGQYTYDVYAVNDQEPVARISETPIATATTYEGETAVVKWSKYIKIGEQWYRTSESSFYATATEAGSKNVVYTTANIDGFYEMENLTRAGGTYLTEEDNSYSNHSRLRLSRGSKYYTPALSEGAYKISIPWQNTNGGASEVYVRTRDSEGAYSGKLLTFTATGTKSGTFTGEIYVPDGYSIAFDGNEGGSANNNARMDYMTLTKITSFSKTITAAGWATYCSPCALDLANATGLTDAYIVTGGNNGVLTKTSVKDGTVPANTGLLLKGDEGTATIPIVGSSSTDVSANKLVGVTAETNIDAGTGWVLMNDATNGLGFYQNAAAFTVGANTAYILVSDLPVPPATARASYLLFDDMTGISQVAGGEVKTNGVIYNLNGQRVSNPTKGIYIIDGVKVAIE